MQGDSVGSEGFFPAEWRTDPLRGSVPGLLQKPVAFIDPAAKAASLCNHEGSEVILIRPRTH